MIRAVGVTERFHFRISVFDCTLYETVTLCNRPVISDLNIFPEVSTNDSFNKCFLLKLHGLGIVTCSNSELLFVIINHLDNR